MNTELKLEAKNFYLAKSYQDAMSYLLKLDEDTCVNFLLKYSKKEEWLQSAPFCQSITDENLSLLLSFPRIDELLNKHFATKWDTPSDIDLSLEFQLRIANLAPLEFVNTLRVTQAFLLSPRREDYCEITLPSSLRVHSQLWKILQERESFLWNKVQLSVDSLVSNGPSLEDILVDLSIAMELEYFSDKRAANLQRNSHIYGAFIELLLSKLPCNYDFNGISRVDVKNGFLKKIQDKLPINESVVHLVKLLFDWFCFIESDIDPYCFDLKIQPQENAGIISYNRLSSDYYKWELDGRRYDISKVNYGLQAEKTVQKAVLSGDFIFRNDSVDNIEYEIKSQSCIEAINAFLKDLALSKFPSGNGLDSLRFFHPLIAASNVFKDLHKGLHVSSGSNIDDWYNMYSELRDKTPSWLNLDTLPFLFLEPQEIYDAHNGLSVFLDEKTSDSKILIAPFIYKPRKDRKVNRFNFEYDVYKKPFLKLGKYVHCPMVFFVTNDWFYSIAQNALENLDIRHNGKLRKETSSIMENNIKNQFNSAGFEAKVYEGHEFEAEEGDVDIEVNDGNETLLIQVKRTKLRLNLRNAYFESINTDRKASRQINKVVSHFKSKSVSRWIVSNSFENAYTEVDGCVKVNLFDLIATLNMLKENRVFTLRELIDMLQSDSSIREMLIMKKVIDVNQLTVMDIDLIKSPKYSEMLKYRTSYLPYAAIDLPLSLTASQNYQEQRYSINSKSEELVKVFNSACDYFENKDYSEASKKYEICMKLSPADYGTLLALSNLYAEQKLYSKSISVYEKAFEYYPNDLGLLRNYALTLLESDAKDKADEIISKLREEYWYVDLQLVCRLCDLPEEIRMKIIN